MAAFAPHQGSVAFAAWLHGYLDIEILRFLHSQARHPETLLPATSIFELCDGPDAPHWEPEGWQAQREEMYRRLHNFALTPRQRECALAWIGGQTLQQIGAAQDPPISKAAVCKIIQRVGKLIAAVDDQDNVDRDTTELIQNLPAALTLDGQRMRDKRVRMQANLYAMLQYRQREGSRVQKRGGIYAS